MAKTLITFINIFLCLNAYAAVETTLGPAKIVKITQKVSIADCEKNFQVKEYTSFCKVQVWNKKDTDLFATQSETISEKIPLADGSTLRANLTTNTEGFYWFIFDRKLADGMPVSAISFHQAQPHMQRLIDKLEAGEVYWKIYRLSE